METKINHAAGIIPITLSRFLERTGYYGIRSILILYMIKTPLFPQHEMGFNQQATAIYTVFLGACALMPLLGGLLADLLIGIRWTALIGLLLQAVGCFLLAIPALPAFYTGLLLISLGVGFYSPSILSMLSFTYSKKKRLMDAAMLIFYISVTFGAFAAQYFVIKSGEEIFYAAGFILAGFLLLGSFLVLLLTKSMLPDVPLRPTIYYSETPGSVNMKTEWRVISLIMVLLVLPFFWFLFQLNSNYSYEKIYAIPEALHMDNFPIMVNMLSPLVVIVIGILLCILWTYFHVASFLKMMAGFAVFAIACFLMMFVVAPQISNTTVLFIVMTMVLQSVAELFIAPIALAYICKYAPVKFNASIMALSISLSYFASTLVSLIMTYGREISGEIIVIICGVISIFAAILFLGFHFISRERFSN